jgi:hypothetical protein
MYCTHMPCDVCTNIAAEWVRTIFWHLDGSLCYQYLRDRGSIDRSSSNCKGFLGALAGEADHLLGASLWRIFGNLMSRKTVPSCRICRLKRLMTSKPSHDDFSCTGSCEEQMGANCFARVFSACLCMRASTCVCQKKALLWTGAERAERLGGKWGESDEDLTGLVGVWSYEHGFALTKATRIVFCLRFRPQKTLI